MISVEDAVAMLRLHDTLSQSKGTHEVYHGLSHDQALKIADLIEHLQSKCDLEVNELLTEVSP